MEDFIRGGGQVEKLEKKEIYKHYYEQLSGERILDNKTWDFYQDT
jgi:hypothetical protein